MNKATTLQKVHVNEAIHKQGFYMSFGIMCLDLLYLMYLIFVETRKSQLSKSSAAVKKSGFSIEDPEDAQIIAEQAHLATAAPMTLEKWNQGFGNDS